MAIPQIKIRTLPFNLALAGVMAFSSLSFADPANQDGAKEANHILLPQVVVTATRQEQNSFDLPVSIDVVDMDTLRDGRAQVNLSESAIRIPGVVVSNRNNYAQDMAVSTRGFGARSQFGVRGVRLYADGIPMTMPDGQGQTGTFILDTARSIEFLRGPFSALYGNSSGGVVQLFTEDGPQDPTLSGSFEVGSYGSKRESTTFGGQVGNLNYIVNAAHQETDGYRVHSESTRNTLHGKFTLQANNSTKITLVATSLEQPESQDPLGLTKAQFQADPSSVYPTGGGVTKNAITENTHVDRNHTQSGIVFDHQFSEQSSMKLMGYFGVRENQQYLASTSAAASTVSTIDRQFGGVDARWTYKSQLAGQPFSFTAGMNYDNMEDGRKTYSAIKGIRQTAPTRDEIQTVHNFDQFAQVTWEPSNRWFISAGLRHTQVDFNIDDHFLSNGNQGGSVDFGNTNPVAGVTFKLTPTFNLYANAGKGFETPTFVEVNYDNTFSHPNLALQPSESKNYEVGAKAIIADMTRVNLALFKVDTQKEIVVDSTVAGQTAYKNAGDTERKGVELSVDSTLPYHFNFYAAYTLMDAEYKDPFQCFGTATTNTWCTGAKTVNAGNKIPGTYSSNTYAELSWKHPASGFSTAIEAIHFSRTYVNDLNNEWADPYTIFNWRGSFSQEARNWEFKEFLRIDNFTDRNYVGSVKVNESLKRYYEPSPPRNWLLGLNASYRF